MKHAGTMKYAHEARRETMKYVEKGWEYMIKNLLSDYIRSCSFGRIKDSYNKNPINSFWIVYFPISCIFTIARNKGELQVAIMELAIYIPAMLVVFSIMLHPVRLTKMHYLCPMQEQERLELVKRSYFFRVTIHMLIFVTGIIILCFASRFDPLSMLILLLNDFIASTLIPVEMKSEKGYLHLAFIIPIWLITNVIQLVILSSEKTDTFIIQLILFGVFFLIELPLYLRFTKHIKRELHLAASFEEERL